MMAEFRFAEDYDAEEEDFDDGEDEEEEEDRRTVEMELPGLARGLQPHEGEPLLSERLARDPAADAGGQEPLNDRIGNNHW